MDNSDSKSSHTLKIEKSISKLEEIQIGLRQNLANLRMKIETFYSNPEFPSSLESLKKDAEIRESNLEAEVKHLREEIKSIKELLSSENEEHTDSKA